MGNYHATLREQRLGVMLHYDASTSDRGAVTWLTKDPACRVSYNLLVLDSGEVVEVAPVTARAWHAGICRSSDPSRLPYRDANSAFLGIAVAAGAGDQVTPAQLAAVVRLVRDAFDRSGWLRSETWRIVGHETEAWPRGRKHDPTGPTPARPVLSVAAVRQAVSDAA